MRLRAAAQRGQQRAGTQLGGRSRRRVGRCGRNGNRRSGSRRSRCSWSAGSSCGVGSRVLVVQGTRRIVRCHARRRCGHGRGSYSCGRAWRRGGRSGLGCARPNLRCARCGGWSDGRGSRSFGHGWLFGLGRRVGQQAADLLSGSVRRGGQDVLELPAAGRPRLTRRPHHNNRLPRRHNRDHDWRLAWSKTHGRGRAFAADLLPQDVRHKVQHELQEHSHDLCIPLSSCHAF